ncbi:MAG TPA: TetR/AcrR family transcriptional regulator [Acidobacteriaceae bacterium]|jgi:AcrR family transcriptional regulator
MGYDKGKLSREQIIEAGAGVVLAKGYAATTIADLSHAAHTSAGKLTHHFPTKVSLFEVIFGSLMEAMEAGPLATLADNTLSPKKRIHGFLDGMYQLYAKQPNPIGCPLGHAAGDSDGVSPAMKEKALKILQRITSLFDAAFRDLGEAPGMARVKANLFVSAWQGAIVIARAGEGLEHIGRVFRYLKDIVPLSC